MLCPSVGLYLAAVPLLSVGLALLAVCILCLAVFGVPYCASFLPRPVFVGLVGSSHIWAPPRSCLVMLS